MNQRVYMATYIDVLSMVFVILRFLSSRTS